MLVLVTLAKSKLIKDILLEKKFTLISTTNTIIKLKVSFYCLEV